MAASAGADSAATALGLGLDPSTRGKVYNFIMSARHMHTVFISGAYYTYMFVVACVSDCIVLPGLV